MYEYSTTDSTAQGHLEPSPASRSWGGKERSLTWHIYGSARLTGVEMGQFSCEDASWPPMGHGTQGQGGDWAGDVAPYAYFWKSSTSGPGDSETIQRRRWRKSSHPWPGWSEMFQLRHPRGIQPGHSAPACVAPGRVRAGLKGARDPTEGSPSWQPLPAAARGSHRVGLAGREAVLVSVLWAGGRSRAGSQRREEPCSLPNRGRGEPVQPGLCF